MKNFFASMLNLAREREWKQYKITRRNRLKNTDFTIIGSNCTGAFMYYDLGIRYLTPTVNLSIEMDDFVKMVDNLKWYMDQELTEVKDVDNCPVGLLNDIKIYFVHYNGFEEGKLKWEERKTRINWDNIFIVGSEKDGCTYETIKKFEQLPYENKVIFTHTEYPEISSAYCIKGFEEKEELGTITNFNNKILKRRYMDEFDYVDFLNGAKKNQIYYD